MIFTRKSVLCLALAVVTLMALAISSGKTSARASLVRCGNRLLKRSHLRQPRCAAEWTSMALGAAASQAALRSY